MLAELVPAVTLAGIPSGMAGFFMSARSLMAAKRPVGRPSTYSPEIAARICDEISTGMSLVAICLPDDMPARSSVFLWLGQHREFSDSYARAREAAADLLAEEIIGIADQARDKEDAPAIKVRVEARMWVASKLKPRVYGNIAAIQHTGADNGPLQITISSADDRL